MSGETDLYQLIRNLNPILNDEVYIFCSFQPDDDLINRLTPVSFFDEAEGLSLILDRSQADKFNISYDNIYRKISLNIHSSLEAVGFTSAISTELAKHGIPVNIVAAFYHDHLFIPADRAEECMQILEKIRKAKMG